MTDDDILKERKAKTSARQAHSIKLGCKCDIHKRIRNFNTRLPNVTLIYSALSSSKKQRGTQTRPRSGPSSPVAGSLSNLTMTSGPPSSKTTMPVDPVEMRRFDGSMTDAVRLTRTPLRFNISRIDSASLGLTPSKKIPGPAGENPSNTKTRRDPRLILRKQYYKCIMRRRL